MKLLCSFYRSLWFLVLLGVGSLLLLAHLQDLSDTVQHQTSGAQELLLTCTTESILSITTWMGSCTKQDLLVLRRLS